MLSSASASNVVRPEATSGVIETTYHAAPDMSRAGQAIAMVQVERAKREANESNANTGDVATVSADGAVQGFGFQIAKAWFDNQGYGDTSLSDTGVAAAQQRLLGGMHAGQSGVLRWLASYVGDLVEGTLKVLCYPLVLCIVLTHSPT